MPRKKTNDELPDPTVTEELETALKNEEKPRSLEFFRVVDGFSKSMYYRLQYEIRPNYSRRMTLTEWRKLLEKVQRDDAR